MGGWRRYLELQAKAKTGLSSDLFVWALVAVVFGVVTFGFVLATAFIWLADRYEPLIAALALGGILSADYDHCGCLLLLVASPDHRTCRAGARCPPECAVARPGAPSRGDAREPRHRRAQARSADSRRGARCRHRDTMARPPQAGCRGSPRLGADSVVPIALRGAAKRNIQTFEGEKAELAPMPAVENSSPS